MVGKEKAVMEFIKHVEHLECELLRYFDKFTRIHLNFLSSRSNQCKTFLQLDMFNFPKKSLHEKKNIIKSNTLYLQPDFRIVFTHTRLTVCKLDLL